MRLVTAASVAACVALSAATASADLILVPPSLANTEGGFGGVTPFAFPTTSGVRTQVAYDASLFGGVSTPQLITAIQFRPIDPTGGFFGDTLNVSNVRLQLSTTQRSDENRNPLSTTFANNVGADVTTVFSGALSLTTQSTLSANGVTRNFDYVITLQTPFVYDPSKGNLLLDTLVPVGETVRGNAFFGSFPRFDTASRANDGLFSVTTQSGLAATGTVDTSGPVTRFVTTPVAAVPEPASLTLAGIGGVCLLLGRRLNPSPHLAA